MSLARLQVARPAQAFQRFGNWHTIYTRMNRWSKSGVLDHAFEQLQREQIVRIRIGAVSLDSTTIKVHSDGIGALNCVFFPRRPSVRCSLMSSLSPKRSSNSRSSSRPPAEVTRDPWKSTLNEELKESRKDWLCCSPTGCGPPEYFGQSEIRA
jgi:hypothetical protein